MFISPVKEEKSLVPNGYDIEFERHDDRKLSGYLIDLINQEGGTERCFFMPVQDHEIESWIIKNGEDDYDYQWEEDWSGGFRSAAPFINKERWNENVREFLLCHQSKWKHHE